MNQAMIDIESISRKPNAMVVSIGAVIFDPTTDEIKKRFYKEVDIRSYTNLGIDRDIEPDTVLWWMEQSDEARKAISKSKITIISALKGLKLFLGVMGVPLTARRVWANAPVFDCVILRDVYQQIGMTPPWNFRNDMC